MVPDLALQGVSVGGGRAGSLLSIIFSMLAFGTVSLLDGALDNTVY